jgi:hypothetical protein
MWFSDTHPIACLRGSNYAEPNRVLRALARRAAFLVARIEERRALGVEFSFDIDELKAIAQAAELFDRPSDSGKKTFTDHFNDHLAQLHSNVSKP